MKNNKKIFSAIIAAFMALGLIVAPIEALAVGAPSIGKMKYGNFTITSVKPPEIKLVSLTKKAKAKKSFTLNASYKLDSKFTDQKTNYKVVGIKDGAFKGSKAKTIVIKGKFDPDACKGMLKGSKATKVTIKVPKSKVAAWKKYKSGNKLGMAGSKITIKAL